MQYSRPVFSNRTGFSSVISEFHKCAGNRRDRGRPIPRRRCRRQSLASPRDQPADGARRAVNEWNVGSVVAYVVSARDAGDVTGGLNAADALLDLDGVQERFATYFNQTFNRARLQRAQRPPSVDPGEEFQLPLPQDAGGEFGQAAVYNSEVTYDVAADEWSVTDDRFRTAEALYLANQDVWIGHWGGSFYAGRGVPGQTDEAPASDDGDGDGSTDDGDGGDGGDGDIRLGAMINGWEGRTPSELVGETNPTLTLEAGTEYVLVWENLDGVQHNFAIQTEDGEDVLTTDLVREENATQTVTFTASTEMSEYYCQVHPGSMRGDLQIED